MDSSEDFLQKSNSLSSNFNITDWLESFGGLDRNAVMQQCVPLTRDSRIKSEMVRYKLRNSGIRVPNFPMEPMIFEHSQLQYLSNLIHRFFLFHWGAPQQRFPAGPFVTKFLMTVWWRLIFEFKLLEVVRICIAYRKWLATWPHRVMLGLWLLCKSTFLSDLPQNCWGVLSWTVVVLVAPSSCAHHRNSPFSPHSGVYLCGFRICLTKTIIYKNSQVELTSAPFSICVGWNAGCTKQTHFGRSWSVKFYNVRYHGCFIWCRTVGKTNHSEIQLLHVPVAFLLPKSKTH